MKFNPLNKIMRLPHIVLAGIGAGLFYWIIDAAIMTFLFREGNILESIFIPTAEQVWTRFFIMFLLVGFSQVLQAIINNRRRVEKALEESEERFKKLMNATFEGIIVHDEETILDANPAAARIFNYELSEITGQSLLKLIAEESRLMVSETIRSGLEKPYEALAVNREGKQFRVAVSSRRILWRGKVVRVTAVRPTVIDSKTTGPVTAQDSDYFLLFNNNNDPLFVYGLGEDNRPGRFIEANDIACRMFGFTIEELTEKSLLDFIVPEEADSFLQICQTLPDFRYTLFETEIVNRKGRRIPLEISTHLFEKDGGALIISSTRDLTERRKAEDSLKQREKRYRTLFENSPMPYCSLDETASIVDVNGKWLEVFGYSRSEVTGKPLGQFAGEDSARFFNALFGKIRTAQAIHKIELDIRRKDGTFLIFAVEGNVERDDMDGFVLAHCVFYDITTYRRIENALTHYEEGLRHLLDNVREIVFTLTSERKFLAINREFVSVTGWTKEECQGQKLDNFVHPDDEEMVKRAFGKCAEGEAIPSMEIRLKSKTGEYLDLELNSHAIKISAQTYAIQVISTLPPRQETPGKSPQKSEGGYQNILDAMPDFMVVVDTNLRILFVNQACQAWLTGIGQGHLQAGDNLLEKISTLKGEIEELLPRVFEDRETQITEVVLSLGENRLTAEIRLIPVMEQGQPARMAVAIRDIGERKLVEETLKQSEEKYRCLFENMEDGVVAADTQGKVIWFNPAALKILQTSAEKFTGQPFAGKAWPFISPEGKNLDPKTHPVNQALHEGRSVKGMVLGYPVPGGQGTRWLSTNAMPYYREGGEHPERVYITFTDITELKISQRLSSIQRDLGIALTGAKTFEETLRLCVEAAVRASEMDCAGVYMLDEATGILNLAYAEGVSKDYQRAAAVFTGDSEQSRTVRMGKPFFSHIKEFSRSSDDPAHKEGLRALAVLPIYNENSVIGSLNVASHDRDTIPEETRQALEAIAIQISAALAKAKSEAAMKESEKRFRQIAENIKECFWIATVDGGQVIYASPSYETIWGRSCEQLYQNPRSWQLAVADEDRQMVTDAMSRRVSGDYDIEYRIRRPDGQVRWIRDRAFPVRDDYGEIYRIAGIAEDITNRKQADEALVAEKELSDGIVKTAQAIILVTDNEGKIISINPYMEEIGGYELKDVIGQDWLKVYVPDDQREVMQKLLRLTLEEMRITRENGSLRTRPGKILEIEWHCKAMKNSRGETLGVLAIGQDVTERRTAESALRESEMRFRSLFDNMSSGVTIFEAVDEGSEFRIKDINKVGERVHHSGRADLVGRNIREIIPRIEEFGLLEVLRRVWQTGQMEFRAASPHREGQSSRWYEDYIFKLPTGELVTIYDDITERKLAEIKLRYQADLLENVSDAIISTDTEFVIRSWNKASEMIFGWKRTEAAGKNLADLLRMEFPGNDPAGVKERIFQSGGWSGECHQQDASGERRQTLGSMTPLHDSSGKARGIVAVFRDITDFKQTEDSLHSSKESLKAVFSNAAVGIGIFNTDGRWTEVNRCLCDITGYSAEELCHLTVVDITHPDDREISQRNIDDLVQGRRETYSSEKRYLRKDGQVYWVSVSASSIRDKDGKTEALLGVISNINEQKRQEAELRQSEERLRLAVQNVPVMVAAIDENGNFIVWNHECEKVTGYPADKIIDNPRALNKLYPDRSELEKFKETFGSQGNVRNREHIITCQDGSKKVISITNVSGSHSVPGWHTWGIGIDITDRKAVEEALLESEARFRSIVESSVDGIILIDESGQVVEWNSGQEQITGLRREDVLGMPIWDVQMLTTPEEKKTAEARNEVEQAIIAIARTGDSEYLGKFIDNEIVTPQGNRKLTQNLFFTIKSDLGHKICVISRDITESRLLEKEYYRAQKLESVGLLAGGIAHDFNNILTAILGNISLARMSARPEDEIYRRLIEAEKASERAQDLTRQLLTFSKGGAPLKKAISITHLIKETCDFALRGSRTKAVYNFPADISAVTVDEGQISQVINNLIINADQAMPEGGTIEVAAQNAVVQNGDPIPLAPGNYVKLTVKDEGIGISPENIRKIFDPYFTTKKRGNGLGLATSYSIIKKHDGHIAVESRPGEGATFSIYLPATEISPEDKINKDDIAVHGGGRILVMDDEESIRNVTGITLEKLGYEVECASDGGEALIKYQAALAAGRRYDAIIMDLTIPGGMGGQEAMEKLREIDPEVRAIVSSGYSNDPIVAEHIHYGFSGVILKPFKASELGRVVKGVIEGSRCKAPSV